jgi:separase
MASLRSKADAAKAAVSSITTCTSATTVTLKELLLPDLENPGKTTSSIVKKSTKAPATKAKAASVVRPAAPKAKSSSSAPEKEELSAKEKAVLATHVINASLKALGDAAKPPPPQTPCKRQASGGDLKKTSRAPLRRSSSVPISPLQPRSLNRVSTSPTATAKPTKSIQSSSACLATVECARVAFACLRSLRTSGKLSLPDLQLEAGISSFIGKLIGLGLQEHAIKEIRLLKRLLEAGSSGSNTTKSSNIEPNDAASGVAAKSFADLLEFQPSKFSGATLGMVISTQLHTLRILSMIKKPAYIEAAAPFLNESCPTSPLNLMLKYAGESSENAAKSARNIDLLSQLILSLTPSVSTKDDAEATEGRLSPSPSIAIDLQAFGLSARMHWWKLAGHKGDVDKDILSPFSRCIAAYLRRLKADAPQAYQKTLGIFNTILAMIKTNGFQPSPTSKSPLSAIYQALGSAAQDARQYDGATSWIRKVKDMLSPSEDSAAKLCSVAAQLLAVSLKQPKAGDQLLDQLKEVIEGLQGSLRGDTSELEDLMANVSMARRSAVGRLVNGPSQMETGNISTEVKESIEALVLQCPRFSIRWLGKPPAREAGTKDFLRYEQRRQLLVKSVNQILDSALMVTKILSDQERLEWSRMDSVLQDCLTLLEYMGEFSLTPAKNDASNSYYVKISHLYFMSFNSLRRKPEGSYESILPIRTLRRSIDVVRDRPTKEKEKAQLIPKLERLAGLCKAASRVDDAREALQSICTNMVEEGVLSSVASALSTQPPTLAWILDEKAEILSRTLSAITKLGQAWNDWTFFLPELERAVVLEHLMHTTASATKKTVISPTDPSADALLRIYALEKYPIRRLRTLIHLLAINIDNLELLGQIQILIEAVLRVCDGKDHGEDAYLARYIPHLRTYYSSMIALANADDEFPKSKIHTAVSLWRSIIDTCQTKEDIYNSIDNPLGLVAHLNSLARLSSLKGESSILLSVLELSTDISKMIPEDGAEDLIVNNSLLATEYVNIGYLSKAESVLEKTKEFAEQTDGSSTSSIIAFQLSSAEYLLSVGSIEKA